ncbi:Type II secretion pathway-like protein [Idiomarina loihiensis]|uniref:Type II secretion pathway-like protein n=1 Tax=Idiomarina loihiensis TaxID=135577 RepID=UPI003850B094
MNAKGFALILTLVTLISLSSASLTALLFYAQMIEAQQHHQWQQLSQQIQKDLEAERGAYEQAQE